MKRRRSIRTFYESISIEKKPFMEHKGKIRLFFKTIFLNILFVCLIVAVLEVALHFFFPRIQSQFTDESLFTAGLFGCPYGHTPSARGFAFGAEVVTDVYGFRVDPQKPADSVKKRKFVFLGDSVTMGLGVRAQDTFVEQLDTMLPGIHFVNTAVQGFGFTDYICVLPYFLDTFDFEGVIVGICLNDFSSLSQQMIVRALDAAQNADMAEAAQRLSGIKHYWQSVKNEFRKNIAARSRLYQAAQFLAGQTSKNYYVAEMRVFNRPDIKTTIEHGLLQIQKIAEHYNKKILFIVFPFHYQFISGDTMPQKLLSEVAGMHGLELVDLFPYFQHAIDTEHMSPDDLFLFNDPMHLSVVGHIITAEVLCTELNSRGWFDWVPE